VDSIVLALQVVLAVVFATAGVGKLLDRAGSRRALAAFGVPHGAVDVASWVLPLAELATAGALVFHPTARWGATAALVLLMLFIFGIARALSRGEAPDCHCFGQLHSAPAGRGTLARNAVLAALAGVVVVYGPGTSLDAWVDARSAAELVAVAIGIVAAVLGTMSVRLWLQNRELRGNLQREREVTARFPPGLPPGSQAPRFALQNLDGETTSLEALLEPGQPLALIFVSPNCGPCAGVLPDLARWQNTLSERLSIGVLSTGSALDNQRAQELRLANVLPRPSYAVSCHGLPRGANRQHRRGRGTSHRTAHSRRPPRLRQRCQRGVGCHQWCPNPGPADLAGVNRRSSAAVRWSSLHAASATSRYSADSIRPQLRRSMPSTRPTWKRCCSRVLPLRARCTGPASIGDTAMWTSWSRLGTSNGHGRYSAPWGT
jgi:uncharacterized membrane protein YphA (DoxX/SURF4 family)